jgi:putative OPT family oligopeptide transporter
MTEHAAGSLSPPRLPAFRPLIPAAAVLRELNVTPLIVGVLLGVIFGASSLYLVLKVGLTVSASIPVAVISITLFRLLGRLGLRSATVLEHNIVQTAGSAGESIAFGIGVTMPAIMILGFDLQITRVILVGMLGGLLGILMMIPLRRALIVQQHGVLKYPEGTACAEVLKAGATAQERALGQDAAAPVAETQSGAAAIFAGFGAGVVYKLAMEAFKLWKDTPEIIFGAPLTAGSLSAEISPELLGVGYIIGPRIASTMAAGGVLAYLLLIPAIRFFGGAGGAIMPPGTAPIATMGPDDIRGAYVLYIGAGAVAVGGIISVLRALPMIVRGVAGGIGDWRAQRGVQRSAARPARTDQDLPPRVVGVGLIILMAGILLARDLHMNILGAGLILVFGFLFVTVSSRLTGEIGSSSNPISGMTVATLLLTCLVFLAIGWTGPSYYVTALSVGGIVCVAASNGGTTSQDLKTGFLIGSTPRAQQIAILCGAFASALALGPILLALNEAATVYVPLKVGAPHAASETVSPPTWRVPAARLAA